MKNNCWETEASEFASEIELDESYFGGVRKGKRGRGTAGKFPVFGILKRGGKVYTQIIDNTKTDTLIPIIRLKVKPNSVVNTDSFRSCNALDVSEFKHYRINFFRTLCRQEKPYQWNRKLLEPSKKSTQKIQWNLGQAFLSDLKRMII